MEPLGRGHFCTMAVRGLGPKILVLSGTELLPFEAIEYEYRDAEYEKTHERRTNTFSFCLTQIGSFLVCHMLHQNTARAAAIHGQLSRGFWG